MYIVGLCTYISGFSINAVALCCLFSPVNIELFITTVLLISIKLICIIYLDATIRTSLGTFFWFGEILGSASLSNHVGFTP